MTEAHKRTNRHPTYKTAYHVNNWREYDKALRDRGDITLWLSQEAIDAWTPPMNGKRGAQPVYSAVAIETALTLRLLSENVFARFKRTCGDRLRAKRDEAQEREASLACQWLTRMRELSRPPSYPVS